MMRKQVAEVAADLARIDIALELEDMFEVQIQESDVERTQTPSDFVTLISRLAPNAAPKDISAQVLAALARANKSGASELDLGRTFKELFAVHEDG
jgi:hypothetical protein